MENVSHSLSGKGKQLNSNLSFIDPLGRHHSGRKGDYLVESSDGAFSITPRRIFEDVYVAMPMEHRGAFVDLPEAEPIRRKAPQAYRERRAPPELVSNSCSWNRVNGTAGGFLGDRSADVADFD
jgi:hypothetical protein